MINKKKVEKMIPVAIEALNEPECGILSSGKDQTKTCPKEYRSQISSFGASISLGSFKAAVLFFSEDSDEGKSKKVNRSKLIKVLYRMVNGEWLDPKKVANIIATSTEPDGQLKEKYIVAAVALKLALNLYINKEEEKDKEKEKGEQDGESEPSVQ